jgi:hypothetical protein
MAGNLSARLAQRPTSHGPTEWIIMLEGFDRKTHLGKDA